jgi:predicted NBD/HSP70 family sugar kinase
MKNLTNPTVLDLRRNNRQKILQLIYFSGSITRPELIQQSGLSAGTVANVVTELLSEDILIELGMEESQGGRPRTILSINPDFGYFVGIDIGETHVCLELFDITLNKIGAVLPAIHDGEDKPFYIVKQILDNLNLLLQEANISMEQIIGVGIGVPGVVDRERPDDLQVIAPIWNWKTVPLYSMLKNHLDIPIYLDNGAKAMTQAEAWFKVGQPLETMVALLIGTGVGGGIIQHGELYRGPTNSAGELGHTIIELKGRPCRCGSQGCLEAYLGALGILERVQELDSNHACLKQATQKESIATLVEMIASNDRVANQVLKDTGQYLGAAIVNIVNIFNPQLIILGGWLGILIGPYILDEVERVVKQNALKPALKNLKIELAQFGDDAISLGAATLALEDFLANSIKWGNRAAKFEKNIIRMSKAN